MTSQLRKLSAHPDPDVQRCAKQLIAAREDVLAVAAALDTPIASRYLLERTSDAIDIAVDHLTRIADVL